MTTIKIIIADTQYLVRIGLENLLSANKDFKVIGEVSNSKEMLEMVQLHQPEVVIFDYNNS